MNSTDHVKTSLIGALIPTGLITVAWLVAASVSNYPLTEGLWLTMLQTILAFLTFAVLAIFFPRQRSVFGPQLVFFVGLHVLIYYGLSNVVPALLPELRPEMLFVMVTHRIPMSPAWVYSLATIAAALLLLGLVIGSQLASICWPLPNQHRFQITNRYAWLPQYKLAMLACVILLVALTVGTIEYGLKFTQGMLSNDGVANLPFSEQLIYHGLFYFLPIAPVLAAAALVHAATPRQRQLACWLLVIAGLMTFTILLTWGMRSIAMLALALPMALLVHTGKVGGRKIVLPVIGLVLIVYGGVTFVRGSDFPPLIARTSDITQLSMSDVFSALATRAQNQGVLEHALADACYRTAGLEGTASLIRAQTESHLSLQLGETIKAGFMQALPVFMRPVFELPERIKTAPSYLGIFEPGDWVTTLLPEFVLDFGPLLLVFPAVLAGVVLALIDRALLMLGQCPALEGLLIVRIAFLLFMIYNGGSLAEITLMFFKATIGYTTLFLLLGNAARFSLRQKRLECESSAEII